VAVYKKKRVYAKAWNERTGAPLLWRANLTLSHSPRLNPFYESISPESGVGKCIFKHFLFAYIMKGNYAKKLLVIIFYLSVAIHSTFSTGGCIHSELEDINPQAFRSIATNLQYLGFNVFISNQTDVNYLKT